MNEEKYSIHQPEVTNNIFGLPAIPEATGDLVDSYKMDSVEMRQEAAQAVASAKRDVQSSAQNLSTQYYVMPEHTFDTGDAAIIPAISLKN